MQAIGGYFEWELIRGARLVHEGARAALKSGRACIRMLIQEARPEQVWVPYYSCDALLEPLNQEEIPYRFYHIDGNLEIAGEVDRLGERERLVYINYFGLKSGYLQELEKRFRERLWADQTHAFFYSPQSPKSWHFNSARKFFGVPDGGYLYGPAEAHMPVAIDELPRNTEYRCEHLILRLQGDLDAGYKIFQENETLSGRSQARISQVAETLLSQLDLDRAARKRAKNFTTLHTHLRRTNTLPDQLLAAPGGGGPFCYPYLPPVPIEKAWLWERRIFVPALWRECLSRSHTGYDWEKRLAADLLALPVDHRYGSSEMLRIIEVLDAYGK